MSLISFLKSIRVSQKHRKEKQRVLQECEVDATPDSLSDWNQSLTNPTEFYLHCFRFFHQRLPEDLRRHRTYFSENGRGFGEDAFHVMWFLLFEKFRPSNFLEIGVYRGQTLSLAALLQKNAGLIPNVTGISPFQSSGDSVSRYKNDVDYFSDTLANFQHFNLPKPELLKAFSTNTEAVDLIRSRKWDCIYIDGNHDYDVVLSDWKTCSAAVKSQGIIVLDDASRDTNYTPPIFATSGHPGPSRLAQEIDRTAFREILRVGHNRVFQKVT